LKSLLLLWKTVARETATWCCTSADFDIKTVEARTKTEGKSFLTITLPAYGKAFENSLDQGWLDLRLFTSWKCRGELPLFLGGFLDRVFDRDTGRLLDEPCVDAIIAVRQLTLMFGKLFEPCSDARTRKAMREFIECDNTVKAMEVQWNDRIDLFCRISSMLFGDLFTAVDRKIYFGDILPKHGPGATADRLVGNEKFSLLTWTARLESIFPFGEYIFPSASYWEQFEAVDILEPDAEVPVKVTPVPKTAKTPRIIAIEPTCMQYVQQGLLEVISEELRSPKVTGSRRINHLRDLICSDDQVPNQELAYEGSRYGDLATLDLSEASDRVSSQLVFHMLRSWPHLRKAAFASRSTRASVPGESIISLAKFASMGSALCFPIEAMVFLTCVFIGIEEELNRPLTRKDIMSHLGRVRIYGDDIIVPVEYVHSVIRSLELFGAKVNRNKSFWTGKFRESCGKEYYDGTDVSIVRVRHMHPSSLRDATEVISWISLRNQFYKAGYWQTAKWLDSKLSRIVKHYPVVAESSPVQSRHSYLGYETQGTCKHLHSPLVKGYVIVSNSPINTIDEYGALLKFFLKRSVEPYAEGHLERSGRPRSVALKPRMASPF
jgi:hypothetical protein